jgi:hypothetical protein
MSRSVAPSFPELIATLLLPPAGSFGLNEAAYNGGSAASHVADDGCLHVVADRTKLREALQKLDLQRARVLTKVGGWFDPRCVGLTKEQLVQGIQVVQKVCVWFACVWYAPQSQCVPASFPFGVRRTCSPLPSLHTHTLAAMHVAPCQW